MKISAILLAGVSALTMAGAAQAADLIISEPALPVAAAAHDWSGAYVGLSGGYATGTVDWTGEYVGTGASTAEGSFDASGWLLGAQAGANVQMDSLVLGIEGDVSWTNITGDGPVSGTSDVSTTVDWLASLRGRAGVAFDSVLLYATAGVAFAGGSIELSNLDAPGDNRSRDFNAMGWTAGIGAEVALDENISLKGEYLYSSLTMGEEQFNDVAPSDYLATNADFGVHTVKLGLNFAF